MYQVHVALAYRPQVDRDLLHEAGEKLMQQLVAAEERFSDMTDSTVGTDLADGRLDVELLVLADSHGHAHIKAVAAVHLAAGAAGFTAGPPVSSLYDTVSDAVDRVARTRTVRGPA